MNSTLKGLLASKESGPPHGFVFTTEEGKQIRFISSAFQRVADELFNVGLSPKDRRNRMVFHTLRHTVASTMAMKGVPLTTIKEILGHSSLSMVERYSHLAPEAQRKALESLEDYSVAGKEYKAGETV
jgi:integrase